jgi:cobalamin biosynthesis Mg chelatase CobN
LHPDNLTGSPVIFEAASDGAYSFYLRGTDFAGNYEIAPVAPDANITVKTSIPEPVIKIKEGSDTTESSAHISGTVEPGSTVLVNGKPVSVDAQGKYSTTLPLSDGANKIIVTVTDRAGNTRTVEKTVNRNAAFPMTPVLVIALVMVVVIVALAALFVRVRGKKPGTM